jgi:hypothetical protein
MAESPQVSLWMVCRRGTWRFAARIDVQAHTVAGLDRRLGQIDSAIEEAAKRGRTTTALTAIEAQRKSREALAGQRQREAQALAGLKSEGLLWE